jgi:hypothetical protein
VGLRPERFRDVARRRSRRRRHALNQGRHISNYVRT